MKTCCLSARRSDWMGNHHATLVAVVTVVTAIKGKILVKEPELLRYVYISKLVFYFISRDGF